MAGYVMAASRQSACNVRLGIFKTGTNMDILEKITRHIQQLAPHQFNRENAQLLLAAKFEICRLRDAIILTLEENGHLADGGNCTLIALVRAMRESIESDEMLLALNASAQYALNFGLAAIELDAARYRWLKNQAGLTLESDFMQWTREDGTKFKSSHRLCANGTAFGAYQTLDETIDAAMTPNMELRGASLLSGGLGDGKDRQK